MPKLENRMTKGTLDQDPKFFAKISKNLDFRAKSQKNLTFKTTTRKCTPNNLTFGTTTRKCTQKTALNDGTVDIFNRTQNY